MLKSGPRAVPNLQGGCEKTPQKGKKGFVARKRDKSFFVWYNLLRLRLHELSGIMTPSQQRGCHHGEITASA